jgi:hypothetical protein
MIREDSERGCSLGVNSLVLQGCDYGEKFFVMDVVIL